MFRLIRNSKGVTLTEVMISVGIVAITTLGFMSMYTSTKRSSEKNIHRNSCQGYVNAVAARIRGMGSANRIEPLANALFWTGNTQSLVMTSASAAGAPADTEPGIQRAQRWVNSGAYGMIEGPAAGPYAIHNAHLIHGAINGMLAVYNSNPAGYCGAFTNYNYTPANLSQKLLPVNADGTADMFGMRNVDAKIMIIPYSRSTGSTSDRTGLAIGCPANLTIIPRGGNSTGVVSPPIPTQFWSNDMNVSLAVNDTREYFSGGGIAGPVLINGGLRIRIQVNYQDKHTADVQSCEGEIKLEYADDREISVNLDGLDPDVHEIPPGGVNPSIGLVWNAAYANRDKQPDIFNNVRFRIGINSANFEPGSMFFCRDRSWRIQKNAGLFNGSELMPHVCTGGIPAEVLVPSRTKKTYKPGFIDWSTKIAYYRMPQSYYTEISGTGVGADFADTYDYPNALIVHPAPTPINENTPPGVANSGNRAHFFINNNGSYPVVNFHPSGNGWVHCSRLTQCGRFPAAVATTTRGSNGNELYWQLTYNNVQAGCTFNSEMAVVDTAGNVMVSQMRELNTVGAAAVDNRLNLNYTSARNNTIYYSTCGPPCSSGAAATFGGCPQLP